MRRHLSFLSKALLVPAQLIVLLGITLALAQAGELLASTHAPYITSIFPHRDLPEQWLP